MFMTALAIALSAQAQEATGVVKGRVSNAGTGQYLKNAVVSVDGTGIKIRTAEDGSYIIPDLPVGVQTLSVTFTGLDTEKLSVEVVAGQEKTLDFDLTSEVYVLGQYVVSAEREGSAKAIQEQRESNSMKNVIAADSFGNLVDGNVGELMKNLPGFTIDYADGEDASRMSFRGMDPSMMSVTMNGNAMANNAGSTTRSFALNDLAVQNIESIEVNFAPTPDQPSNTLGGSVNFKTKSAFNQKGRRIRLDGNLSMNAVALDFQKSPGGGRTPDRKIKPGFNLSYSEAFGKKRPVGVVFNIGMAQRYRFNNAYIPSGYSYDTTQLEENGGKVSPNIYTQVPNIRMEERAQTNERWFAALNLDWKLSESTSLYLYNSYTYDRGMGNYSHQIRISPGAQVTEQSNYNTIVAPTGSSLSMTTAVSNIDTKSWSINPGVKHRFGNLEIAYDAYLSQSKYTPDPNQNYRTDYSLTGIGYRVDNVSSKADPVFTQTGATPATDYLTLNNYGSLGLTQDFATGTDTQRGAKIDGKKPFHVFGMPLIVQIGGRVTEAERDAKRYYRYYRMTGNSGTPNFGTAAEPKLAPFRDIYFTDKWNFDVPVPDWVSPYRVWDYYTANPDKFYPNYIDLNTLNTTLASDYVRMKFGDRYSKERVWAGYGMATFQPFPSLTFVGGARYEFTELLAKGWLIDTTDRPFAGAYPAHKFSRDDPTSPYYGISDQEAVDLLMHRAQKKKSYDKVFPNLQAKYEPIKDLFVRAAFTTNMGRADLNNIMPSDRIYDHLNLIRRNNPRLLPQEGNEINVRVEYYLPRSGLVGITVFKQHTKNYIAPVVSMDYIYNEDTGVWEPWTVESTDNIGVGDNKGFEINYRQRLGWIAKWMNDLEFYCQFSRNDPTAKSLVLSGTPVYQDNPDPALVEAYLTSPKIWNTLPLPGVINKSAVARLTYNGKTFTASINANWNDDFARSINFTTNEIYMQRGATRFDVSATVKLSAKWKASLDIRNVTGVPDYHRMIFGRTNGYYTSGRVINLGLRADL